MLYPMYTAFNHETISNSNYEPFCVFFHQPLMIILKCDTELFRETYIGVQKSDTELIFYDSVLYYIIPIMIKY